MSHRHRPRSPLSLLTPLLTATVVVGLLAGGCGSGGVNQGDFNLISLEEEWALGQRLERDLARRLRLVDDAVAQRYLDDLGRRLVSQTEMARLPWKFHLVSDPQINAFNIPGGHVYVNTGLIAAAEEASQLAGVLGHEISHGVARHGTEQLSKAYGFSILASLALGENPAVYEQILAQLIAGGSLAKFSRDAEREADVLGVRAMYGAGYDPAGMVRMFQELLRQRRARPSSVNQFFSTHPLTETRIEEIESLRAQLPAKSLVNQEAEYQQVRRRVT